ncbi:hypothetical protein JRC42_19590 [Escherichia albertii]|uniref:hypothetical protein n=1 Tax=Escherichia albertii TaxID=208962 RepID=UPI00195C7452|nr:hypothetical protein [Escherichia albertii]QST27743.1 hypothetical protein JRC42_19590 [Escherichia albertii]QST37110.1 hypothetical protein JRC46_19590 [Escherichia albertii]
MKHFFLPLGVCALLLSGCGDEPDDSAQAEHKQEPAPVFTAPNADPAVNKLLPAIRHLLPGLDKYSAQFQEIKSTNDFFLTITFKIPDDAKIPNEYAAHGHTCFIYISRDQRSIQVPKEACQSVMLDRDKSLPGSDYWMHFYPDDLTYTPYDFTKMKDKERVDTGVVYLKKVWDTVQEVKQKTDWQPYDFPNYGRLFRQLEDEGEQFVTKGDMFPPYGSCRMVGANAQIWWSELTGSLKDLSSNDPEKVTPAVKRIVRQYNSYEESAKSCAKEIREAPPVKEEMDELPSTPDNKPPRKGCLAVYHPDNPTTWSCPKKAQK